jgi:hypothetical protein
MRPVLLVAFSVIIELVKPLQIQLIVRVARSAGSDLGRTRQVVLQPLLEDPRAREDHERRYTRTTGVDALDDSDQLSVPLGRRPRGFRAFQSDNVIGSTSSNSETTFVHIIDVMG